MGRKTLKERITMNRVFAFAIALAIALGALTMSANTTDAAVDGKGGRCDQVDVVYVPGAAVTVFFATGEGHGVACNVEFPAGAHVWSAKTGNVFLTQDTKLQVRFGPDGHVELYDA